jgi:predicted ABC-type transport system involved in lysophospholipase L1 biosynthesis ATPase subunit
MLMELHRRRDTMLLVVTHSAELAARLPLRRHLHEGRLQPA